jgi:hypothetical protein
MGIPRQSLEEAVENSLGREAEVSIDPRVERRRCGTKSNFVEIGFSRINLLKIKGKNPLRIFPISESRFNAEVGFRAISVSLYRTMGDNWAAALAHLLP